MRRWKSKRLSCPHRPPQALAAVFTITQHRRSGGAGGGREGCRTGNGRRTVGGGSGIHGNWCPDFYHDSAAGLRRPDGARNHRRGGGSCGRGGYRTGSDHRSTAGSSLGCDSGISRGGCNGRRGESGRGYCTGNGRSPADRGSVILEGWRADCHRDGGSDDGLQQRSSLQAHRRVILRRQHPPQRCRRRRQSAVGRREGMRQITSQS